MQTPEETAAGRDAAGERDGSGTHDEESLRAPSATGDAPGDVHGPDERRDRPGSQQTPRNMRALGSFLGAAAAPPAAVTALAYYFAVKRQEALALHFGIDPSVLGFSTQDYLLRGGDALFLLALFASLTGLAVIRAHTWVMQRAEDEAFARWARRVGTTLQVLGAAVLVVGVLAVFAPLPFPHFLFRSLSLGLGIVALAYGRYLRGRLPVRGHAAAGRGREPSWVPATNIVLVAVVALLSVFWATKDLAQALGRGQALELERSLSARPGTIVYSERPLHISAEGTSETALAAGEGFRFRYGGLRLLVRSGGRYFLVSDRWTRTRGVVVVIADDPSVRIEFTRGRR